MTIYHFDPDMLERLQAAGNLSLKQTETLLIAMTNVINRPQEWESDDPGEADEGFVAAVRTEIERFMLHSAEFGWEMTGRSRAEDYADDRALLETFNSAYPRRMTLAALTPLPASHAA